MGSVTENRPKLFHWHVDGFDYVAIAESEEAARGLAIQQAVAARGVVGDRYLGHIETISAPPLFIAEANYCIVIWKNK